MFGWRCNERKSKILTGRRIDKALASGVPIYAKAASNVGAKPMHFKIVLMVLRLVAAAYLSSARRACAGLPRAARRRKPPPCQATNTAGLI